jgi:hypothetical protein
MVADTQFMDVCTAGIVVQKKDILDGFWLAFLKPVAAPGATGRPKMPKGDERRECGECKHYLKKYKYDLCLRQQDNDGKFEFCDFAREDDESCDRSGRYWEAKDAKKQRAEH